MIFWVVALVLTVGALALLLRPLSQKPEPEDEGAPDAVDHDIAVYKSQLEELDRDRENGRLSPEEADAARVEIGRRLIAADDRRQKGQRRGWHASGAVTGGVAAILVAGTAFGVYYTTGMPGTPDNPLAGRAAELALAQSRSQGDPGDPHAGGQPGANGQGVDRSLDAAAAKLRKRLESGEGTVDDWLFLGRTELMRQAYAGAAKAFEQAMAMAPEDMSVKSAYGEALVLWAGGEVTDRAQRIFSEVVAASPVDPRARFYLAEAKMQAGDPKGALEAFIALTNESPADAPWLPALRARAEGLASELGIDIAGRLPDVASGPPALPPTLENLTGDAAPGPTAEQVAEAESMAPEDRQDMIQGMVDGLAERLQENPMDFQGWMRLIRSRMVLKEPGKAQEALNTALQLFDGAPVPKRMLAETAAEFDLTLPDGFVMPAMPSAPPAQSADSGTTAPDQAAAEAPPGPTQEDVTAAQEMSPEDRQTMVEGMVAQLSERLATETPDDVEGWMQLARSYDVLRRDDDALAALVGAAGAAERTSHPELETILIDQARLRRAMAGNAQTPETIALMKRVAAMNPDNIEALWFLGIDAVRQQDKARARTLFDRVLADLPDDAPEKKALAAEADRLVGAVSE